jgi:hypothetical protein
MRRACSSQSSGAQTTRSSDNGRAKLKLNLVLGDFVVGFGGLACSAWRLVAVCRWPPHPKRVLRPICVALMAASLWRFLNSARTCKVFSTSPTLGRFLIRLCNLVGEPRGRPGPFFRLPGRGGHLGEPATKLGGRGRPVGHAAVPPAVPRLPLPLAGPRGAFFFQGGVSVRDKWLNRAGAAACRLGPAKFKKTTPLVYELQHHVS